jgi:hypothetical protein
VERKGGEGLAVTCSRHAHCGRFGSVSSPARKRRGGVLSPLPLRCEGEWEGRNEAEQRGESWGANKW